MPAEQLLAAKSASRSSRSVLDLSRNGDDELATIDELEHYIELLYEELPQKVHCARLILQLARGVDNIEALASNESLMSALSRTLREDSKKSLELITHIAQIFFLFSQFSRFHPVLMTNKIGDMSLKLIDQELMRVKVWQENCDKAQEKFKANSTNPSVIREYEGETRKLRSLMAKQDHLLYAIMHLLLNMAGDLSIEVKIVKRGILSSLLQLARTREGHDVVLAVVSFIKKLCIFNENKDKLLAQSQVFCLAAIRILQFSNKVVNSTMLQLLVNLSHDSEFRNEFVKSGLVTKLVDQLRDDTVPSPELLVLLYQISTEDRFKAIFMYTNAIPLLLKHILETRQDRVEAELICLTINLCCSVHNAEMFCEEGGLKLLVKRVVRTRDPLLMRMLRTITQHDVSLKMLFLEHIDDIMHLFSTSATSNSDLNLEILGLVGNLSIPDFDYAELAEAYSLAPYLAQVLQTSISQHTGIDMIPNDSMISIQNTTKHKSTTLSAGPRIEDDYLLETVIVCGTFAIDDGMEDAWLQYGICELLVQIMTIYENDDEMTLQLLYCFYHMLLHERTRQQLLDETQLAAFLVDLLYDRNVDIRRLCDMCLDIIADISPIWYTKIKEEKFHLHNAHWMVATVAAAEKRQGRHAEQDTRQDDTDSDVVEEEDSQDESTWMRRRDLLYRGVESL